MTNQYTRSSGTTAEHIADRLDNRDEDVMEGLVTAGAFVALADGRIEEVERDELLDFIDRQQLAPTIPRAEIAEAFERRVRQFQDRDSAEVILENLRPGRLVPGIRCASRSPARSRGGWANPSPRIASARTHTPDHDEPVCQRVANEASPL